MNSFSSLEKIRKEFDNLNVKPLANFGITVGLPDEHNIFRWLMTL